MEYYYGQALVMGKPTDIRVKPEMIKDEIIEEIELYLPSHKAVPKSSRANIVDVRATWEWKKKRKSQDPPLCMNIWVEVDGVKQSLKFPEN